MINRIMFWEWTCSVLCYHNETFLLRLKGHLHHPIYLTVESAGIRLIREASYKLPHRPQCQWPCTSVLL